jgi:hypothetical protein
MLATLTASKKLKKNIFGNLMIKHLSIQGKLDPRGGLYFFWCPKKT